MSALKYQEEESNIFGLKMARGTDLYTFDPEQLTKEIIEGGYDVCRIKLELSDTDFFKKLNDFAFYNAPHTLLIHSTIELTDDFAEAPMPPGYSFENYNGSQREIAAKILREGLSITDRYSYRNLLSEILFPAVPSMDAAVHYFLDFNNTINPAKEMQLLKYGDTYIGCICLEHLGEETDTRLLLVKPEYHNQRLAHLLAIYGGHRGYVHKQPKAGTNVAIQNIPSLRTQFSFGLKFAGSYYNALFFPLLSASKELIGEYNSADEDNSLHDSLRQYAEKNGITLSEDYDFRVRQHSTKSAGGTMKRLVTQLMKVTDEYFVAGKEITGDDRIMRTFYLKGKSK